MLCDSIYIKLRMVVVLEGRQGQEGTQGSFEMLINVLCVNLGAGYRAVLHTFMYVRFKLKSFNKNPKHFFFPSKWSFQHRILIDVPLEGCVLFAGIVSLST